MLDLGPQEKEIPMCDERASARDYSEAPLSVRNCEGKDFRAPNISMNDMTNNAPTRKRYRIPDNDCMVQIHKCTENARKGSLKLKPMLDIPNVCSLDIRGQCKLRIPREDE